MITDCHPLAIKRHHSPADCHLLTANYHQSTTERDKKVCHLLQETCVRESDNTTLMRIPIVSRKVCRESVINAQ